MKRIKNILFYLLFLTLVTCTEPFPIETITYENILVVESTITNEMKKQVVKLSRTIPLTDFGQAIEKNAIVTIEDGNGTVFDFSQDSETGNYMSDIEFQSLPNVTYTLKIKTQNGQNYISDPVTLTPIVEMDRVYPEFISNNRKEGIQVLVDTDNSNSEGQYFRYEYEETYKVLLPRPSPFYWEIVNYSPFTQTYQIELTERERFDLTCYSMANSEGILQTTTSNLGENKIVRFPIRFISRRNTIIKEQYSILVKQYVQSPGAYTFYQILEDLGNVESLLSQGQPGYVTGNIVSSTNSEEKVLGFFEASSVSSKRIFFSYQDFEFELPPYFIECDHLISYIIGPEELRKKLSFENYQVFFFEEKSIDGGPPRPVYHISQSECSECASYSTHIKPDFWED